MIEKKVECTDLVLKNVRFVFTILRKITKNNW
jgi:hypothetical protein